MAGATIGYVGVDHHHRDPYFRIAEELDLTIAAICEPGVDIERRDLRPLQERPDEITASSGDIPDIVRDAVIYRDPKRLIESETLDAIWITYANDRTPEIVEHAVDNGVHVLSEKPIARTATDLKPIVNRADSKGIAITPTFFYRANPIVRDLREMAEANRFGQIWSLDGRFIGSQLVYRNTDHYIYDRERSRGGVLQWIGLHWLDMMMYVIDEPFTRVCASIQPAEVTDVEAGATLQFETGSGIIGTFQSGYYLDDRTKDTHLGIYGTDLQARSTVHHGPLVHSPTTTLELISGNSSWEPARKRNTEYTFSYERFPEWGDSVLLFFDAFFSGIETGTMLANGHDAVRILELLDATYTSAEQNEWVDVGD